MTGTTILTSEWGTAGTLAALREPGMPSFPGRDWATRFAGILEESLDILREDELMESLRLSRREVFHGSGFGSITSVATPDTRSRSPLGA
jgi:hypothetical protein